MKHAQCPVNRKKQLLDEIYIINIQFLVKNAIFRGLFGKRETF